MTDQHYLVLIKNNDPKVISELFKKYKDEFFLFARKNHDLIETELIEDAYSEAFHGLYRNVQNGKLVTLTSKLKTYLFQIGKYKLIDELNQRKRLTGKERIDYIPTAEMLELDYFEEQDEEIKKKKILNETVGKLKEPCKTLLHLFYYECKKDKEIISLTHYKTVHAIKNKRSLCMRELKEKYLSLLINEHLISEEKKLQLLG